MDGVGWFMGGVEVDVYDRSTFVGVWTGLGNCHGMGKGMGLEIEYGMGRTVMHWITMVSLLGRVSFKFGEGLVSHIIMKAVTDSVQEGTFWCSHLTKMWSQ